MDVSTLLSLFRTQVQDELVGVDDTNTLWKDEDLRVYLSDAQNEFCRRVDHLADASTTSITQLTVTADDPWIALSPKITKVREAILASNSRPMIITNLADVSGNVTYDYGAWLPAKWETVTGTPRFLVMDIEKDKARLSPIPTASDTIILKVYRLPLEDATCGPLEIAEEHYIHLLKWVKGLAYEHADSEIADTRMADRYKRQFLDYVEQARTIDNRLRKRARPVRYGGL